MTDGECSTTAMAFDWSRVAPAWDRHRDHVREFNDPLAHALLDALELQPGQRVLELGAGTGDFAGALAAKVGSAGSVLVTDVAPGMVELLRRAAADLPNVEARQLDALDLDLPERSVDAVVFRMGLMFVPDPARALAECLRVLTPSGHLALATWAAPEHNPWLASVGMSVMMHGLFAGGPPTSPGGVFSLSDPATLEALVREAGYEEVTVRGIETPARFRTPEEHFETVSALAGPVAAVLVGAEEQVLTAIRATTAQTVERFRTDDGLEIPGRALLCSAVANAYQS